MLGRFSFRDLAKVFRFNMRILIEFAIELRVFDLNETSDPRQKLAYSWVAFFSLYLNLT